MAGLFSAAGSAIKALFSRGGGKGSGIRSQNAAAKKGAGKRGVALPVLGKAKRKGGKGGKSGAGGGG
jgi:hypothetical protein